MAGFLGSNVPVWDAATLYDSLETPVSKRDMLVNNIPLGQSLASQFSSRSPETTTSKDDKPTQTVVLMRRHGFSVQADSIEMAVYRGIYTKINAKAQTDAMAVARNWEGTMGSNADGVQELGLTQELVVGCTEMNERFQ
ncbi:uncharacterized protein AB675_3134 [Cyphellophora attinorum]|uniref:Uncharacterized protein n=1 Tax=Cyphellophora attinorum TaxID=1664694 RepID=A0A0N1HLK0_9EURO|nr:uncharacterized protein AB675_3134 [Phialophora attinorum]KPI37914.1 hypothetical protein AB675_3134 [Phialophora attinorum]